MERKHYYTDERNTQIVIALLKAHGVRDLVISPGATNDRFVLSVQGDSDFTLYSAVDERHAGYLACGIAQETGRPVVINCTGATASRNYMSALTEAYYRKLPIIALTCSQPIRNLGQMSPQMTDRVHLPTDIVNLSVQCPMIRTEDDAWDCALKVNRALLETSHRGGGPVHINLETDFDGRYTTETLPRVQKISRIVTSDDGNTWPSLDEYKKIVVWIGAHQAFDARTEAALEKFLVAHNAVALTDLTSNYRGKNAIRSALILTQSGISMNPKFAALKPDLIIHIGELSGDYTTRGYLSGLAPVWRVNEDGELRDPLRKLVNVFEMPERTFFEHYAASACGLLTGYADAWKTTFADLDAKRPQLPFSSLWIANSLVPRLPESAYLHLGILNPLRCWGLTNVKVAKSFCTVGGFGIDGGTSAMLGSALAKIDVLHFGVFGDLSFFYDLNALGSRHITNNLRLLVVNNGEGGEFSVPGNISDNPYCGDKVHDYIAARGHFGYESPKTIKLIAEAFGFEYISASSKEELDAAVGKFVSPASDRPILLECRTTVANDRLALEKYNSIEAYMPPTSLRSVASSIVPTRMKNVIKVAIGK